MGSDGSISTKKKGEWIVVEESIQRQAPYFKMSMEKKTGRYASVTVKVSYLVAFDELAINQAQDRAYRELKQSVEMLNGMLIENEE